jgi:Ca2+/H+ antiporter, TMEM165/GDT1 family
MNWNIFWVAGSSASIEFLETAAIAYAIARSGYRFEAIWGSITGLAIVAITSVVFRTSLQLLPLFILQLIIGAVLIWFGWGWMKKSIRRQAAGKRAGWMADDLLDAEGIALDTQSQGFNRLNFLIMTKSAALEALEVAIIVVTLGLASGAWYEALAATCAALVSATVLVFILHPYLVKIPEVLIKLVAGILLSSLGTFWLGEGLSWEWWLGDLAILAIVAFYSAVAVLAIYWLKQRQNSDNAPQKQIG